MKFKAKKDKNFRTLTVGLKTQLCKECAAMGRRICEVDGKPAFFHRWINQEEAILRINNFASQHEIDLTITEFRNRGLIRHNATLEKVRHTYALVEYEDGTVGKVEPEKVKFRDGRAPE